MKALILVTLTLLLLCGFAGAQNTFCAANQPCNVTGAWTFTGPTTLPSLTLFRGRIDATTFAGTDMCAKINAAWTYAAGLGLGYGEVDATGFHGRQDVAVSCFASFPATPTAPQAFVGLLKLAPDVKIVTSVTQNPPTSVVIDGGSAWIWSVTGSSTFSTNMGATFLPSDTFNWATQKAVFTLGYTGGTTNPRGIWFQNVAVGCVPPNGTYTSGSIGIYNGLSQEGTGGERVFVYGCTEGIDIENDGSFGGSQNSGPWKQLNIQAAGVVPSTESNWIGVDFCGHSNGLCDENRGIDGGTFSGPGAVGSIAVSVSMSNVAIRNVSSEMTSYTVDLGTFHSATGITLDNIQGEGHTTFNTRAIVHTSATNLTTFTAMTISANQFQRTDYLIEDLGSNGLALCGGNSLTSGSPCFGATTITWNLPFYSAGIQTGYSGGSRVVFAPHPAATNNGINATGGVVINNLNTNYTASAADKGKLIRMTPLANNVTFTLPATPPSATWWVVVQSVNTAGFTTSIDSSGTNVDGSPTSTTPVVVAQAQNIMIWTNGTFYYSVRWSTPYKVVTGSIGGSALAAGACTAASTPTLFGATVGAIAVAKATDGTDQDNYIVKAFVATAGTVSVKVCAITAGTPTAKTYNVTVWP